jgi:hypothetical protein
MTQRYVGTYAIEGGTILSIDSDEIRVAKDGKEYVLEIGIDQGYCYCTGGGCNCGLVTYEIIVEEDVTQQLK